MEAPAPTKDDARLLNARVAAEKLKTLYAENVRNKVFHVLLTGETGTGKTHLLRTARRPVHIDSFDPGGTIPLQDLIEQGHIIVDNQYEQEDRTRPTMYAKWQSTFDQRLMSGYFNVFSTYCLDSSTLWSEAVMNYVILKASTSTNTHINKISPGDAPRFNHDFSPQKNLIQNAMRKILTLPCDVIVTGHLSAEYETRIVGGEEVQIKTGMRYMTTGQGRIIIPLMFSELWVMFAEAKGTGTEYKVLTAKHGLYQAKTRIGSGKFATFETPDIKALLKKAGWPTEDKPALF